MVKSLNQTKQKSELCTNEVFNTTSKKILIKTIEMVFLPDITGLRMCGSVHDWRIMATPSHNRMMV